MSRITDERLAELVRKCGDPTKFETFRLNTLEALNLFADLRDAREDMETVYIRELLSRCPKDDRGYAIECPDQEAAEGCRQCWQAWLDARRGNGGPNV